MAFAKFQENRCRIDGEIVENHAILVNLTASIGLMHVDPPPPVIGENIEFSCIFLNKVKLTSFFQPKCGLRPLLLNILDPPLTCD